MVNDVSWWNNEFINNWEVGFDGKEQTLYFAQLMLANLPEDVKEIARDCFDIRIWQARWDVVLRQFGA